MRIHACCVYKKVYIFIVCGISILHVFSVLQPDEIWKEIEGNQEFTEHATAKFSHTLEFSLTTQQRKCIRRLYQLIVDLKSKQNSKSKDVVASQILWQLLQVKRFDPREVRSFICSLWNVVGVNQILQQGSMGRGNCICALGFLAM